MFVYFLFVLSEKMMMRNNINVCDRGNLESMLV